jgi:hypothetical protein
MNSGGEHRKYYEEEVRWVEITGKSEDTTQIPDADDQPTGGKPGS